MQTSSARERTSTSTLILYASAMFLIAAIAVTSFLGGMAFQARQAANGSTGTTIQGQTSSNTATSHIIFHQSGNGEASTKTFTVEDSWTLTLKCSGVPPSGIGGSAPVYIFTYGKGGTPTLDDVSYECPEGKGGGTSSVFHDSGAIYLKIISGVNWDVTVTE